MAAMATSRTLNRRLDLELVARDLAPSREQAQAFVAAGLVEVDGTLARSAAQPVRPDALLRVLGRPHPWASRGGVKLAAALDAFGVTCADRVALDAGASTGGFTDVLLSRGAALVYAVDVGHGLLDGRLASDPRVVVLDRTNVRHLQELPGQPPNLVTLDLSFISLRQVLPALAALVARPADVVALFKPQFELGRDAVGRGGVVRDIALGEQGAQEFIEWAEGAVGAAGAAAPLAAAIRGTKGNQEWLVHLVLPAQREQP
jgi:23S rRNA (cytidine1920-2'-O)/16S rRNA (cytidine1409-2'-O)-methyltransferase